MALPPPETWQTLATALHVDKTAQRAESTPDAPELSATVVPIEVTDPELLAIREQLAPGKGRSGRHRRR